MAWNDSSLWHLTLTRLRGWTREPEVLFWSFGFPILLTIALGVAFRNRPPEAVDVLVREGEGAQALAKILSHQPELRIAIGAPDEARRKLRAGLVSLVVAPGAHPTLELDPTRPEARLARLLVEDAIQRGAGRQDIATIARRDVTEPGARYVDFLVPGLIGMNLMQSGLWGVGYSIVEMRQKKLLRRLIATPMRRREFLFSFVATRVLFLAVELPVVMGTAMLLFGVQILGSWPAYVLMAVLGSLCFASLGLLVASRARNTQSANGLMNLVTMPMFVGSGVFFSIKNFPDVVQPALRLLPLTALNDGLRAVQNEGAGITEIAPQLLVLAVIGVISMALALRWFRWE